MTATARVEAKTHEVWHASVRISSPTFMKQGVCAEHPVSGVDPATGTAACWRCGTEAPAAFFPASEESHVECAHNHRSPEAAEECGRTLARTHGAKVGSR